MSVRKIASCDETFPEGMGCRAFVAVDQFGDAERQGWSLGWRGRTHVARCPSHVRDLGLLDLPVLLVPDYGFLRVGPDLFADMPLPPIDQVLPSADRVVTVVDRGGEARIKHDLSSRAVVVTVMDADGNEVFTAVSVHSANEVDVYLHEYVALPATIVVQR